jgi:capsular polysaccharide biosynthesis protein
MCVFSNADQLTPRELAVFMNDVDILLGVYGAGLQNMVWIRPFQSVIEIRWPPDKESDKNYLKMSGSLQHCYAIVKFYHLNLTEFQIGDMLVSDQERIVNEAQAAWKNLDSNHKQRVQDVMTHEARDEL